MFDLKASTCEFSIVIVKNITIVLTGYAARAFASIDVATYIPF